MKKRICHISTLHPRYDVRIFHKQCKSLTKNYDVHFIVADGQGDEVKDGINIHDVGLRQKSRLKRARIDSKKAYNCALEVNAELYHFHDPELIPIGLKLKKKAKKVVYDAHEDLPRQIKHKPYLNSYLKTILSVIAEWKENNAAKKFDYISVATEFIRKRFEKINPNSIDINNFPIWGELEKPVQWQDKQQAICYVGSITAIRGIREIIEALGQTSDIELLLGGSFNQESLEQEMKAHSAWKKVQFFGFIHRDKVKEVMNNSIAGMVTLHPTVNYKDALPVKLFEYMMAGIPVISSNILLWQKIVDDSKCGICVDPMNPKEIAEAIEYIKLHPAEAEQMGKNGQQAVKEKYNWKTEEAKLLKVYQKLLPN